ncbi:hypothetical protein EKD04_014620 [Chloroflexales bacterium ZM16-3]|nr:hypothetical protein [Chloroflexales bacterium ZM16-3]
MSTFHLQQELSTRNILRSIEGLREEHPTTITLTISLKLRTSRFKENMLKVAQQRVTNMKSEVLASLQLDLEQINNGATSERFIGAVLALCNADNSLSPPLRQALEAMVVQLDPLALPIALIKAVATAEASESGYARQLRDYLDRWLKAHPDKHLENTLERAKNAKRRIEEHKYEPRYTPEQLTWIRYAILLRKVLQDEHTAQLQARRIVTLAELAELSHQDTVQAQKIDAAIAKRSAGQSTESLITIICASAERLASANSSDEAQALRDTLTALAKKLASRQRSARQKKAQAATLPRPFIRELIGMLALAPEIESDQGGIRWLRQQLEHWYAGREKAQRELLQQKWQGEHAPETARRIRYGVLLNAYMEGTCVLSTDILILAELTEATIREMGDGLQLLFGVLSRCYGETCSRFKYPLASVLRQATFSKCAEGILGWSQLVIDYKLVWDRRIPGNQLPAQKPREEQTFCRKNFFLSLVRRKRVTALPYIYRIWRLQEAVYQQHLATEVPIGPDAGKTLGNSEPAPRGVQRSKGWRQSRVRGERVVGKRGARRIKRWLLKEEVVAKTLGHLEVLEYPDLFSQERQDEAKIAPHPYWTAKRQQRRSVKAVRPAQFRDQASKKPVRLGQLTKRQRFFLRIQLRELKAYATQFAAIEREIDEFLEAAPPRFPSVAPVVFSEHEVRRLPFEAQLPLPELQEDRRRAYEQDLELLRDFRPSRGGPFDSYTEERLYDVEALRAQSLEQSAASLLPTKLQPIAFHRTMSAELDPKSFTLLVFWHKRPDQAEVDERYIFACELAGDDAPERAELLQRARAELKEPREFINYPERYIEGHEGSTLLFFAVEIGDKYQGHILRELYKRQKHAPKVCKPGCPYKETQTGEHLPECDPAAAIGTATITSKVNGHGHDEWFAQLTMPIPTPPCDIVPTGVIGLHEHEGQFFFAVVNYAGQLLDIGEIAVPKHVGPQTRKGKTSKNFAFEIAWQIIRQSQTQRYLAGIAIEDTGWKRKANNTSAEQNRQRFAFPREQIMSLTALKAAQSGMLPPVPIKGVAPTRDCGRCGHQLERSGVRLRNNRRCPHCALLGKPAILEPVETQESMSYQCPSCQRIWEPKISQFKCTKCGRQQYAPYNAAIAVARAMLAQLNDSTDSTDVEHIEASSVDAEDAEAIDEP